MNDALLIAAVLAVLGALLWVRMAFVSLNRDLRVMLAREADIHHQIEILLGTMARYEQRLAVLEKEPLP